MRSFQLSWVLALLVVVAGADGLAEAKEAKTRAPSELELTTTRAVVFKDGHALFVRRGRAIADEKGNVFTAEVPDAAVLGCFWAFAKGEKALGMQARLNVEKSVETRTSACVSILELLRANAGRTLTLRLNSGEEVSGMLRQVLDRAPRTEASTPPRQPGYGTWRPGMPQPITGPMTSERELVREGGALLLIRTARGEVVLPVSQVASLSGTELVTKAERRFERTLVQKRLEFQMGAAKAGQAVELQVFYFAPSLRWIPTYRLAGELKQDANLALQAEILNEAEDLEDVALDLVVGVPNFRFKNVVSPLVLESALRNALNQAAPQLMGQQGFSNASFQSRGGERRGARVPTPANLAPELIAGGHQDMFVYSVPHFSLPRQGRATIPLWQDRVPLRHVHTLDVVLGRDSRAGVSYARRRGSRSRVATMDMAKYDVWHKLELENTSEVPWTTGAALTMQGMLPIAQDLLTYTPLGAKTMLPLTVAVDVRADFDEEEVERKQNSAQYRGYQYARVRKKTTLSVTNFRKEATVMQISLSFGGRGLTVSDGGEIKINDYRSNDWSSGGSDARLNHHTDVEWKVTLKAGETRDLRCEYEFFTR